jgi:2-keto-4-pentenoate hydratase/2-oxohepta-3-ene-1,7-dioic acid hydratase in catechol pathway
MAKSIWSIAQYRVTGAAAGVSESDVSVGVLQYGIVRALPSDWPASSLRLFDEWEVWSDRLRELDVESLPPVEGAQLVAPITYPRKVLCAGANFYNHAAEMGTTRPDPKDPPFFFLKPPTTTVVGPFADIHVPDVPNAGLDWEIELAVVIGRRAKAVSVEEALAIVAGYAVSNDLSARSRFPRPTAVQAPFAWDWLAHKALDESCPLGPGITPAWLVDDPERLGLRLTVNGITKQDSSTAEMVVKIAVLISDASRWVTLEPGDVLLTGTPAGVGMPRKDFLKDGDVVVAEIDGLGRLQNTIVSV